MKTHKASGRSASFETRGEAADRGKARHDALPADQKHANRDLLIEVVRKGDTFNSAAGETLHGEAAITENDVRIVVLADDGSYLHATNWRKAKDRAEVEQAWDEANA